MLLQIISDPMFLTLAFQGVGSSGFFSSRSFVPAFAMASTLAYGGSVSWIAEAPLFVDAGGAEVWFLSGGMIQLLGLLALLEVAAYKSPMLREWAVEFDTYSRTGMSMVTYMGVYGVYEVSYAGMLPPETGLYAAGILSTLPVLLTGGGTYLASLIRNGAMRLLVEADEDDDAGVQGLFSWGEDVWALFGPLLFILFPIVMLLLIGGVIGAMYMLRRRAEAREEQSKVSCPNCTSMNYATALHCYDCRHAFEAPRQVGFFGTAKDSPAPDLTHHPYRLAEKKRCPVCATRFEERSVYQACSACGHTLNTEQAFTDEYVLYISRRVPKVMGICLGLSLIPVIGLIPGVIYYRMTLVAPYRRYLPRGHSWRTKWLTRIAAVGLISFQWVPGVGAVTVPALAYINYGLYRRAYFKQLSTAPSPVPARA